MQQVLVILAGALLGGVWGDGFFGAAVGALLAGLLMRSLRQQKQLDALQAQQRRPEKARAPPEEPAAPAARDAVRVEPSAPAMPEEAADAMLPTAAAVMPAVPATTLTATRAAATAGTMNASMAPPAPADEARIADVAPPPRTPDLFARLKSWFFGGNTIVKLGVGILFIGLAFLAKYASEHVHLPIELRLAGIAGAAMALLGLGWRLRAKRAGYAQVLQGAGVAVLYLTLFVAFRYYHLLPVGLVFALMVLVAALAAALAVLQDARSLAVIGALGGFATPLLVSSGGGNHIALFAYYLVLDLGIAAVAWFKTWRLLNLIGFAATFGVATVWGIFDYRAERYASSQLFLIAYFLLFNAVLMLPARRLAATDVEGDEAAAARSARWVNGSLLFGLPAISFALQWGLVRHMEYGVALSALVLAAFYVAMAMGLRQRAALAIPFDASLAIGTVFLTLVIPFALDARSTAGAWALEGAGLVWLGWRQARRLARAFGYALIVLGGGAMLWAIERHGAPGQVFNAYLFNGLMTVAAALAAAYFVRRARGDAALAGEGWAEPLLIGWAALWAVGTCALQIDALVPARYEAAVWLVAASAVALAFAALSVRLAWPAVAWPALLQTLVMTLAVLESLAALRNPLHSGGAWAWPVALVSHALLLRLAAPSWQLQVQQAAHAIGALVLAALGALAGRALTQSWGDEQSAWPWLGWLVAPALLLMLLPRPGLARRWPVLLAPGAYQQIAAGVLAVAVVLWTLVANGASNGAARPLPHVPLVNPLDLGVLAGLIGVWMWLRSPAAGELTRARAWLAPAVLGGAGFVWINAMLIRAFHHYAGVSYHFDAWTHSLLVHTGITLLWAATALALMWLSAKRALRAPWMLGAALLAAVVLKLLLVDLSGTGTVTRIVSFIGVGILMLLIGYVAPLPAKGSAKDSAKDPAKEQDHAKA